VVFWSLRLLSIPKRCLLQHWNREGTIVDMQTIAGRTKKGDWVPNHTPQRDASAIYYLNETFDGGEIVFDRERLAVSRVEGFS